MTSELARAHATLRRGADRFATWLDLPDAPVCEPSIPHALRSKVIGNALRELDRFLNILIDEACRQQGLSASARQRNTANKFRGFQAATGRHCVDYDRLVALGRSRACLFHCAGIATRRDAVDSGVMTLGWPASSREGGALLTVPLGFAIRLGIDDVRSIGRFYARLADDLVAEEPLRFAADDDRMLSENPDRGLAEPGAGSHAAPMRVR